MSCFASAVSIMLLCHEHKNNTQVINLQVWSSSHTKDRYQYKLFCTHQKWCITYILVLSLTRFQIFYNFFGGIQSKKKEEKKNRIKCRFLHLYPLGGHNHFIEKCSLIMLTLWEVWHTTPPKQQQNQIIKNDKTHTKTYCSGLLYCCLCWCVLFLGEHCFCLLRNMFSFLLFSYFFPQALLTYCPCDVCVCSCFPVTTSG